MYKMIVSDLDETLLSANGSLSAENVELIGKAAEKGVKFVPGTGRGYMSVQHTLQDLGLYDQKDQYMISFNGGIITENKDNRLLFYEGITFDLAQEFFKKGLEYNVCVHVYTKDTVYLWNLVQEETAYLDGRMDFVEMFTDNIDFLRGQDIVKCLYMSMDTAYLRQIEKELAYLTPEIDFSYSSNRYLEYNRKGVNKGNGLLNLARILSIQPEETIAIGDNINDISMIKAAGLGVGVHNAVEEVKPYCDYVTESDCNHSAVAEVIRKFILSE